MWPSLLWLLRLIVPRHRHHVDFPTFGGWHPGSIRVLSHEPARRRSIGHEDHALGNLTLFALEQGLPGVRTHPHRFAGSNADFLHVLGMHGDGIDNGLILG